MKVMIIRERSSETDAKNVGGHSMEALKIGHECEDDKCKPIRSLGIQQVGGE